MITSRSRLSGLIARDGAHRITLDVLPTEEAVHLLKETIAGYRVGDDESDVAELARLCARLPLALRIAAERASARPRMPLGDLIQDLRDESSLWDALSSEDDEEADAVRTVFAWSYRALPADVARMFRLLGLHPGSEFSTLVATALAEVTPARARQLIDVLVGAHLVEQTSHDRFQFHDLLRAYATDQANQEESEESRRAALNRCLVWYLHKAAAVASITAPSWFRMFDLETVGESTNPVLPAADSAQAISWLNVEMNNLITAARAARANGLDTIAWQLPAVLRSIFYLHSVELNTRLELDLEALAAARRVGDRFGEAESHYSLGVTYYMLQQIQNSIDHHRAGSEIRRDISDTVGLAQSFNSLGLAYWRGRRYAEAEDSYEASIAIFRELGDGIGEAIALGNLGEVILDSGRAQDAEQLLIDASVRFRNNSAHIYLGYILTVLSRMRIDTGQPDAALEFALEAISIFDESDSNTGKGDCLLILGQAYLARGLFTEALETFQQASAIHRRIGDQSREAKALIGTGEVFQLQDRLDEAVDFHRRAVAIHHRLGDRYEEAVALDHLAASLQSTGEQQQARDHWAEAVRLLAEFSDPKAIALRDRAVSLTRGEPSA